MNGESILSIGAVVGALCKFLVGLGLQGRWSAALAVPVSVLGCATWVWSHGGFQHDLAWEYLTGFAAVLTTAAGVFHGAEEAAKAAKSDGVVGRALDAMKNGPTPAIVVALTSLVLLAGCGAHAPVAIGTQAPTPAQQLEARQLGDAVVVTATAALQSLDALGPVIDAAPLSTAQKDQYDCALLKVIGTPRGATPPLGGRIQQVCGTLPTTETAPLRQAIDAVHQVTTCASLKTSVTALLAAITPLLDRLSASGNQVLVFAGASLRASLAFAQSVITGGTPCSD